MGNACCGNSEPEHKPPQTDGELAGKIKFLSTPSFCEYTDNNSPSRVVGDNKWFLCVFAPINGHGIAFTAYQNKTNTLMVKYLVDAEIVKEKERQNISISYNMFFKALSTEVARAGRVGAKVTFTSPETVNLDCKIMIAGATSRRPDNFSVELRKIDITPDALFHYVLEPICTQYYKRRANEGWNVERVDIAREKIYGEYETNFILRSARLESNLEMLREVAPRVLQLRREQALLRERREKLLAQLCIARTLLATENPFPERLVRAIPKDDRPVELLQSVPAHVLEQYDRSRDLYQPPGYQLSSVLPHVHRPVPRYVDPHSTQQHRSGEQSAYTILDGEISSASAVSRGIVELCMELGKTLETDLHNYEIRHPSAAQNLNTNSFANPNNSASGNVPIIAERSGQNNPLLTPKQNHSHHTLPHTADTSFSNTNHGQLAGSFAMSPAHSQKSTEEYYNLDLSGFTPDIQAKFKNLITNENDKVAVFRCWRSFLSVSRFDAFMLDDLTCPPGSTQCFAASSNNNNNRPLSPTNPSTPGKTNNNNNSSFNREASNGLGQQQPHQGHSLALTFAMAMGIHKIPEALKLSVEDVHELCSHLEHIQARSEVFFNGMRAADRVQFVSLFLKVIQSGEVPRLSNVPAIEKLCLLCAAAGCRADLHPPFEPYGQPSSTLAQLHIDSANERHSLAVTVSCLRQCQKGVKKFITPAFHKLLADLILGLDPARHNTILNLFAQRVKSATNFNRSLEERRLMYSVLLIGSDCAWFSRNSDIKEIWMKRIDSIMSHAERMKRANNIVFAARTAGGTNDALSNQSGLSGGGLSRQGGELGNGGGSQIGGSGVGLFNPNAHGFAATTLNELRMPLKINLPSTFRIGAAVGFGTITDEVLPSSLILRSEMRAGFTGGSSPSCMQGITRRSHEVYEQIAVPAFNCLKQLAQEALEAHRRGDGLESTVDSTYAVFLRIAKCGYFF